MTKWKTIKIKSNLTKGKNNMRYEQKAHLQDSNKARMYEEKKMEKKEIRKELQSILKDYHYNLGQQQAVVVALENLVRGLK